MQIKEEGGYCSFIVIYVGVRVVAEILRSINSVWQIYLKIIDI